VPCRRPSRPSTDELVSDLPRDAIAQSRATAARLGEDRNDYETEFAPTNVELRALAVAVDLGDAGRRSTSPRASTHQG
jgi:hypothetical protein